jgi:hypothetical protein
MPRLPFYRDEFTREAVRHVVKIKGPVFVDWAMPAKILAALERIEPRLSFLSPSSVRSPLPRRRGPMRVKPSRGAFGSAFASRTSSRKPRATRWASARSSVERPPANAPCRRTTMTTKRNKGATPMDREPRHDTKKMSRAAIDRMREESRRETRDTTPCPPPDDALAKVSRGARGARGERGRAA